MRKVLDNLIPQRLKEIFEYIAYSKPIPIVS